MARYWEYDVMKDRNVKKTKTFGVRIDIWTHFMRGCIIDYVH